MAIEMLKVGCFLELAERGSGDSQWQFESSMTDDVAILNL